MFEKQSNLFNAMNPLAFGVRKFFLQVLGNTRYVKHQTYIDRLATYVQTEQDYKDMGQLIAEVYETGYMKAVEEHREAIERLGYKTEIKRTDSPTKTEPIFSEKSQVSCQTKCNYTDNPSAPDAQTGPSTT